jgi:hypothetical protein
MGKASTGHERSSASHYSMTYCAGTQLVQYQTQLYLTSSMFNHQLEAMELLPGCQSACLGDTPYPQASLAFRKETIYISGDSGTCLTTSAVSTTTIAYDGHPVAKRERLEFNTYSFDQV